MASVRYIILAACQNAGLYAQAGWESEASEWIEKQGERPCAYVGYGRGQGVAGFDNVSVVFGGSDPRAALRSVRERLERSLEFRTERQTEVGGFPALELTARAKIRVYGVFGGGVKPTPPTPTVDYMYFEAVEANSTVSMMSTLETAPNLEYSIDGATWQEWQHTKADGTHTFDTITLGAVGDRVYLRGDNPDGLGASPAEEEGIPQFSHFEMTGKIAAGGNIMSLLDKSSELTEIPAYGFVLLFGDITEENPNTSLTSATGMQAVTTIGHCGCSSMYTGCTALTSAADMPALTAIDEDGCGAMYAECTSLTTAADMPALTTIGKLGCGYMYAGCTALTTAAGMQAVITIGKLGCGYMYTGCTALTSAADMPALTAIDELGCGAMYAECTSLTTAADIPSVITIGELGCGAMYVDCTFDMSDDGSTLNFDFPTPPIVAGGTTYSTAYDVAVWMGNTNGFTEP